jgi:hypothetical protein
VSWSWNGADRTGRDWIKISVTTVLYRAFVLLLSEILLDCLSHWVVYYTTLSEMLTEMLIVWHVKVVFDLSK